MAFPLTRRHFTLAATATLLTACATQKEPRQEARTLSVAALFAGKIDDHGFMESGWRGLERARNELGAQTRFIEGIPPRKDALVKALTELVASGVDLVVAHGGQNNEVPEPTTMLLLGSGLIGTVAGLRKRFRKK